MKKIIVATILTTAAITVGLVAAEHDERIVVKKPFDEHNAKGPSGGSTQILYHGGNVLNQASVPIYAIYYGLMTDFPATTPAIINAFLGGLGGTPQFNVNTTYCNAATTTCPGGGTSITGLVDFTTRHPNNTFNDPGSQGASIGSSSIPNIVQYALTVGGLPVNDNAIYIVMTAPTIKVSSFCTSYCAYHTMSTKIISGYTIHYALVPEPGAKCTVCDGNFATYHETKTPNGDAGADEMVDSIMHEVSETVTDPDISAWYASGGAENGDLCDYVYQTSTANPTFPSPTTGATANAQWGGYYYLIQFIWENHGLPQFCAAAP